VINLAHTGLMAVGVYAEWSFRHHGMPFWPSVFLAALVTGAAGAVIEVVVIRRLYARPLDTILATWGLSLVLVQGITEIYGATQRFLDLPTVGATDVLGTPYSNYRLIIVLLACGLLASLALIVRFTTIGLTIRAVMTNEPLARSHGINTVRVRQLTFITGAALAGFAGAVLGPIQGVDPNFGATLVGTGFLAVLLSGRTLLGLVLSCVLLGTIGTLYARYENAVWANAVVIGVAVIILRFRPQGLALRRS
jgi:branched-chain amino acid transport system permease protein